MEKKDLVCAGCGKVTTDPDNRIWQYGDNYLIKHHWFEDASCLIRKEKLVCVDCNQKLTRGFMVGVLGVRLPEPRVGMDIDDMAHLLPPWHIQKAALIAIRNQVRDNEFFLKQTIWLNKYRATLITERRMMLEALVNEAVKSSITFGKIKKEVYTNGQG